MVFESAGMLYIFILPEGWKLFITSRVPQITVKIQFRQWKMRLKQLLRLKFSSKHFFFLNAEVQMSLVERS